MAKKISSESQKKKNELQAELKRIEKDIDSSLDDVKHAAADSFGIKSFVRKHPIPAIAASLVLGIIVGSSGRKSSKSSYRSEKTNNNNTSVTNLLSQELKRLLVKKGVSLLTEKLDEQIASVQEKRSSQKDSE